MDVGFLKDLKLRKIIRACGAAAPVILIGLFSNIYKDYGYYLTWDGDMPFLIADEVGISEGTVDEAVKKALQVGLFNENLFKQYSILTSKGIQARFVKATERRKEVKMLADYYLLDSVPEHICVVNAGNNFKIADSNQQSKVNYNKALIKQKPANRFNNFKSRERDYDAIERQEQEYLQKRYG